MQPAILAASPAELTRRGTLVRHLRTTFIPAEETAFALYEAYSLEAVAEANRLAGVSFERVMPAIELVVARSIIG